MIAANGGQRPMRLTMAAGWVSEKPEPDGSRRRILQQPELFSEAEVLPTLVVETSGVQRLLPLDSLSRYYRRRLPATMFQNEPQAPCVF